MSALLQASELRFAYGAIEALQDVSLQLAAGEVVALIGPNGSGKSTLIKTLIGALHGSGDVRWADRSITQWGRRDLARLVAYLAQSPVYEPQQTVLEVLQLGRAPYWSLFGIETQHDQQIVRDIASRLGLNDILSRAMDQISGGQRQMVFLGRALVQEPKAILLDEPNTFLDLKHQVELMSVLRTLAREQGVAVLMASHDLNLAASGADRLILLQNGAIISQGTADQVLNAELLTRVYGIPMQRIEREGMPAAVLPYGV